VLSPRAAFLVDPIHRNLEAGGQFFGRQDVRWIESVSRVDLAATYIELECFAQGVFSLAQIAATRPCSSCTFLSE